MLSADARKFKVRYRCLQNLTNLTNYTWDWDLKNIYEVEDEHELNLLNCESVM